jgi:hypothetical protein
VNLRADHLIRTLPPTITTLAFQLEISFRVTIQDRVILDEHKWVIPGKRPWKASRPSVIALCAFCVRFFRETVLFLDPSGTE